MCPLRKAFKGNNQHFILFFKKDKTTHSLKRERFGVCYPRCSAVLTPLPPAQAEKHLSWFCPVPLTAPDPRHHPVHATGVLTGLSTWCFMKMVASPLIQSEASEYLGRPESHMARLLWGLWYQCPSNDVTMLPRNMLAGEVPRGAWRACNLITNSFLSICSCRV